ncbi:hypothetical protein KUV89_08310 [Marinobacter hydrocarbonoclasticus]|nr:hypothetical protein [Marinobacter nauticus]
MAKFSARRLVATLLLGWTLCLSLLASHALAEALHHQDGSALCAQGQLIDHWLHVLPGTEAMMAVNVAPVATGLLPLTTAPTTPPAVYGNRDPPSLS